MKSTTRPHGSMEGVEYQCEKCGNIVSEADTSCVYCGARFKASHFPPRFLFMRIAAIMLVGWGVLVLIISIFGGVVLFASTATWSQLLVGILPSEYLEYAGYTILLGVIGFLIYAFIGVLMLCLSLAGYDSVKLMMSIEENSRRSNQLLSQTNLLIKQMLMQKDDRK